jgi:hypothetical protein
MRGRKVIGIRGFNDADSVNPLRRDFRGNFPMQKNSRLKVGHKLIGAEGVIVTDEVGAKRRDCKHAAGEHDQNHQAAFLKRRNERSLMIPSKRKQGCADAKRRHQPEAPEFVAGKEDVNAL